MSVLTIIIILIVIGFLLWLVNTKIPMDATIKTIINIVVIVVVVLWLLKATGLLATLSSVKV